MNKIITSEETDIEFDPESIASNDELNLMQSRNKRLEAIRDLDNILNNAEMLNAFAPVLPPSVNVSKNKKYNCTICVTNCSKVNSFGMSFNIVSLNQTLVERTVTEIEMEAEQDTLIKFFSFYQNNIAKPRKQKTVNKNELRQLLAKKKLYSLRKKRRRIAKNNVIVTKLAAKLNGKQIKLIDYENEEWRITEMKYAFDNNRSSIKMLLTRNI